ncbi:hypothetical protein DNTS_021790 [Danionella cerebrum]|uniref:Citrate transporter-like domain-containing protein n=1 Tax=Danionella cerebrum TaxID=2873325 RepID=A0A553R851_9TELE|nr:hypothetical protein DNTS_021790 [Danionella translucida]
MMASQVLGVLWRMKSSLILFCTPLLLLPLPIVIKTKVACCAYVVALMAVYWCTEVLPLAVTALLPAVLFPLFTIMESKDVCMQYLKDTNMLFLGGLMVAVAVEHWNLHKRIALRVLLIVGVRPALLMLGFMGVTAFLSMWISNTATTAMMVPIVQAVLEQLNNSTQTGETEDITSEKQSDAPDNPDIINFASWFGFAFPNMIIMLTLAWIWLQIVFLGTNFRKTWGCGTVKTEKDIAAYNVIKEEHHSLGPMSFGELSVLGLFVLLVLLWFTRDPGFVDGWATHFFNAEKEFVTDATVAVFVAALLFVFPSKPPSLCFWRAQSFDTVPQEERVATPALLTWKVTQKKMPWSIILLLGGGFALAKGSEVSGLSKWLGDQMSPLQSIPPWAIAIVVCLMIATFTECTSNSQSIGVNPLYVMVPCTLSASFAFMLPVATPPNAIVFSYGYLKVSDMAKTGIVMNIIGILSITLAINSWGRVIFRLDTFPTWANNTSL